MHDAFVGRFCNWAQGRLQKSSVPKLRPALRKALSELSGRDDEGRVVVRGLVGGEGIGCHACDRTCCIIPCRGGNLAVVVLAPAWDRGWARISRDEEVADVVDRFFFFAEQYVARSRTANALAAIALTYGRACDFRGGGFMSAYTTETSECRLAHEALDEGVGPDVKLTAHAGRRSRGREAALQTCLRTFNCLDPFLHRAVFQYVRSLRLFEAQFEEDALVSLDGMVSVATQFARERLAVPPSDGREGALEALGVSEDDRAALRKLYELRCHFGAHPTEVKWWDFWEIYQNEIDTQFSAGRTLLWRLACSERDNRQVAADPDLWSQWFADNAERVWQAVWFEGLP